ncbi:hypothetical protein [Hydrogenophaga atypica]|uniref:Zona occludens toxin N-terminal domain-containing protein n=1 Tax=Hydrogenophaga atypica TaxID=249409 RepID=A0ABW2QH15_9BURK
MAKLIHIVGPQGSGKTMLGALIIADLKRRGKTALCPQDHGLIDYRETREPNRLRDRAFIDPETGKATTYDVLVIEHERDLPPLGQVEHSDQVIHLQWAREVQR